MSWGETDPTSGLKYNIENGAVTITGIGNSSKDVVVPEEIEGLPVKGIGMEAFMVEEITSIKLPSSLDIIGEGAFGMTQLTEVTIPASVTSIQPNAFTGCSNLRTVTFESTGKILNYSSDIFSTFWGIVVPLQVIYVPKGMKEAYSQQFPDHADIIQEKEMTPTGITNVTKAEKNTHTTIKKVKNGKVVIVKGDKEYTIGGARIK